MKKFKKFTLKSFMVMAVAASFFAFASCTDDDNNGGSGSSGFSANDPEGTVIVNMEFGENSIHLVANSLRTLPTGNFFCESGRLKIVCIGKVAGLSSIMEKDINSSGYTSQCAVLTGYGYITQSYWGPEYTPSKYSFARLFVDSWIKNSAGEIIGAVVKYQDNWIIREEPAD